MNLLREKLRAQGHHLAQFGGGSSSSSAQTTYQTDNRRTIGANGISNENGTVNVLDGGAIANSFDFANQAFEKAVSGVGSAGKNALDFATTTNGAALGFAKSTNGQAFELASKALDFSTSANKQAAATLADTSTLVSNAYADAKGRGAMTDKILIGAVVMAGVVALAAVKK